MMISSNYSATSVITIEVSSSFFPIMTEPASVSPFLRPSVKASLKSSVLATS